MICVVADQLRYPSAHTYFFISFMLWLFASAARAEQPNAIPERISRVLLERIIVQRPHPFGLVVCFVELLNDRRYQFWSQPFAQGDDDISALLYKMHDQINKERLETLDRTEAIRQRDIHDAQVDHDY
jgi:CCR4-NOT transcription complex subunit 1